MAILVRFALCLPQMAGRGNQRKTMPNTFTKIVIVSTLSGSCRDGVALGYDPDKYYEMYSDADGEKLSRKSSTHEKKNYKANRAEILEQQRAAYDRRKEYGEE